MSIRARSATVSAIALAAVLALLCVSRDERGGEPLSAAEELPVDGSERREDLRAVPPAASAARREEVSSDATQPQERWVLACAVEGLPAGEEPLVLRVCSRDVARDWPSDALRFELPVSSAFEVDVGAAFRGWQPPHLVAELDHSERLPDRVHVAVPDEPGVLRARFALRPAYPVRGRVVGRDGRAIEGAAVALFHLVGGLPEGPRDAAACAADGSFFLRAHELGPHALAALHHRYRPSTRLLTASGEDTLLGDVVLDRGFSIAGRALQRGRPVGAGGRVRVELARVQRELDFWAGAYRRFLVWSDAAFESRFLLVDTDEEGRFECETLGPLDYALELGQSPGLWAYPALELGPPRIVRAPAADVELELAIALVGATLPPGARLLVHQEGLVRAYHRVRDAHILAPLRPGRPATVLAHLAGAALFRTELAPLEPGEVVELDVAFAPLEPAALELALEGAPASLEIGLELDRVEPDGATWSVVERTERAQGRVIRCEELVPGRYGLRVFPGGRRNFALFLAEELELELRAYGVHRETLALRPGGRLALVFARVRSDPVRATLTDVAGRPLDVEWLQRELFETHANGSALCTEVSAEVQGALPPGSYRLVLETGERRSTRDVAVVAGETTRVTVEP